MVVVVVVVVVVVSEVVAVAVAVVTVIADIFVCYQQLENITSSCHDGSKLHNHVNNNLDESNTRTVRKAVKSHVPSKNTNISCG